MGASLYRFLVPSSFGWRARFDVDTSHVFPRGLLTAITLERGGVGAGGAGTGAGCEAGPPLCSMAITALLGAGSDAKLLGQKPRGLSSSWFCSLYVCTFPYPSTGTLAPERSRAEARGARAGSFLKMGHVPCSWWQRSKLPLVPVPAVVALALLRHNLRFKSPLFITAYHYPSLHQTHSVVEP